MRLVALTLIALLPGAATAEVTHHIAGRFGVAYVADGQTGQSSLQSLYQGRYTMAIEHQADNGLRFRFELGIVTGNFDSEDRPAYPRPDPRPGATGRP